VSGPIRYIHLEPDASLPEITNQPSRMVVIVEAEVSLEWQAQVSDWIVRAGGLYMMAWGIECSSWDDSVDWANIDKYGAEPIPEAGFVVTTWHDDEPLEEVFWFSKNVAGHTLVDLERTILLHISTVESGERLIKAYAEA
jgi:hypothetical protein